MVHRRKWIWRTLLSLTGLVAGLALPAESHAQNHAKSQEKAMKKAALALTEDMKFEEALLLRKAFLLLAETNHDYLGHQAKAMHAVKAAVKILDHSLLKHGTAQQKAATTRENAVVAKAEEAAKKISKLHEAQPVSDAQLRKAAAVLAEVRPTLLTYKQQNVLKHVDTAIKEIEVALKIQ